MDVSLHDSLDGQVALVSGANRGIGEQIAADLADLGATVYAGSRDVSGFDPEGRRAVALDVTDDDSIEAAVGRIEDEAGRLDVLVNNAGVSAFEDDLETASIATIDRTLDTNLRGPMVLTRAALPLLREREGPRVVNLSSRMADLGTMRGGSPAYRISKVGLNGLTVYLDAEYGDEGLIANSASPGWVATEMGGERAPQSVEEGADTPVWLSRFRPGSPGGGYYHEREPIDF